MIAARRRRPYDDLLGKFVAVEADGQRLSEAELINTCDMVFQMLNAANRDPAHFADPDRFDIRRHPNRHIAFGQGIHFCVGAPLARIEATIASGTLVKRFPGLRLLDDRPDWDLEKRNSRVLRSLRVAF